MHPPPLTKGVWVVIFLRFSFVQEQITANCRRKVVSFTPTPSAPSPFQTSRSCLKFWMDVVPSRFPGKTDDFRENLNGHRTAIWPLENGQKNDHQKNMPIVFALFRVFALVFNRYCIFSLVFALFGRLQDCSVPGVC